jgi:hypothetical protein
MIEGFKKLLPFGRIFGRSTLQTENPEVEDKERAKREAAIRERGLAEKEAAVAEFEANPVRNPEGYKVYRGQDNRPVELVNFRKPIYTFLVNGVEREFQADGLGMVAEDLCMSGLLKEVYTVELAAKIHYGPEDKLMDVFAGIPMGLPVGLVVSGVCN